MKQALDRRTWRAVTAALLALGIGAVWLFSYTTPGHGSWLPSCWFHDLTGLYCTGCGITRAVYALTHCQWGQAWAMNPLAIMGLVVGLIVWAHEGLGRPDGLEKHFAILRDARLWAGAVLLFTVGRNLPWLPFSGWAPG